jgi:hypothetical protein
MAHHAELHKAEWRWSPGNDAKQDYFSLEDPSRLNDLTMALFSIPASQFLRRTSAIGQYQNIHSYNGMIDLTFKLHKIYANDSEELWEQRLEVVTIHGAGFDSMTFNTPHILRCLEDRHFTLREVHAKIDILDEHYTFAAIKRAFDAELYTTKSRRKESFKDTGRTVAVGKKAANGKRLSIYEAWTVHEEIPEGTVRTELQLFGRDAQNFIHAPQFRDMDLTTKTIGVIRKMITFRKPGTDTNKDRLPVADFWNFLTEGFAVCRLPRLISVAPTFSKTRKSMEVYLHQKRLVLGDDSLIETIRAWLDNAGLLPAFAEHL